MARWTLEEDHNAHHHLQRPGGVRLGHALGSCDDAAVLLGPPSELGPGQDGRVSLWLLVLVALVWLPGHLSRDDTVATSKSCILGPYLHQPN